MGWCWSDFSIVQSHVWLLHNLIWLVYYMAINLFINIKPNRCQCILWYTIHYWHDTGSTDTRNAISNLSVIMTNWNKDFTWKVRSHLPTILVKYTVPGFENLSRPTPWGPPQGEPQVIHLNVTWDKWAWLNRVEFGSYYYQGLAKTNRSNSFFYVWFCFFTLDLVF